MLGKNVEFGNLIPGKFVLLEGNLFLGEIYNLDGCFHFFTFWTTFLTIFQGNFAFFPALMMRIERKSYYFCLCVCTTVMFTYSFLNLFPTILSPVHFAVSIVTSTNWGADMGGRLLLIMGEKLLLPWTRPPHHTTLSAAAVCLKTIRDVGFCAYLYIPSHHFM